MKLGIYLDLRNPFKWERPWADVYSQALAWCEEAEQVGLSSVWLSEHHLFADGYLPQPLTFAAAVAARTSKIRIGTAVMIAPFRSAAHIAEEAAVVDIVSNGRLDLGLGAGYRTPEYDLYDAKIGDRYRDTDQRVRDIRSLWADGSVTPGPVQSPMPIWMGYNGPRGARRAGRMGEGLLSADPALQVPYLDGLAEGGHPAESARMAGVVMAYASVDPERDWARIAPYHGHQWESYRQESVAGTDAPKPAPFDVEASRKGELSLRLGDIMVDTPEKVARAILARCGAAPIETVFVWLAPGGLPDEIVREHLDVLGNQVAPLLANR